MKFFLILFMFVAGCACAWQKPKWPPQKKAVIVLTYDDGLDSQLKIAVPQLQAAHLTATFFLTGETDIQHIPSWRRLSKRGFELGNHTLFHPCPEGEDNPVSSAHYTESQMVTEIEVMNNFLYAIDGKTSRTYAYPCTATEVGRHKDYVDSLRRSGAVRYARVGGDVEAVLTDFRHLDPLRVPAYGVDEHTSGEKLIAFVKMVEKSGGMGIFMFHGVGGDYISTRPGDHAALLNYLRKNRRTIWITTFRRAMDYAMATANKL